VAFIAAGPSSSVLMYFQFPGVPLAKLKCELLAHMLADPLFYHFREEMQIAYHVSAWASEVDGVHGVTIEISSHHEGCIGLIEHIEDFLLDFWPKLHDLTAREFIMQLRSFCAHKLERDVSPADEAARHFATILKHVWLRATCRASVSPPPNPPRHRESHEKVFLWNSDGQEAEALVGGILTVQDFVKFYQKHMSPVHATERRKLNILVMGDVEVAKGGLNKVRGAIREWQVQMQQEGGEVASTCLPFAPSPKGR
jgi:hypothetical protein